MKKTSLLFSLGFFFLSGINKLNANDLYLVPGKLRTSWVGNSFPGIGESGFGKWVQNYVGAMDISPDGTVFIGGAWDEAGRCIGLYKNADVNEKLLQQYNGRGGHKAWGWGTANHAIAVDDNFIYAINTDGVLLYFNWTVGDINSAKYIDEYQLAKAKGMRAYKGMLYIALENNELLVFNPEEKKEIGRKSLNCNILSLAVDKKQIIILCQDKENKKKIVGLKKEDLSSSGLEFEHDGEPVYISIDNQGRLLVCDDGERQQVVVYDIMDNNAREVTAWGEKGGVINSGGKIKNMSQFHGLRAAGTDAEGNRFVALGYGAAPHGRLEIRAFDQSGKFIWTLESKAFVDSFGFEPGSDGSIVHGMREIFQLDLNKTEPGSEYQLVGYTLNHIREKDDSRLTGQGGMPISVRPRFVNGNLLLFLFGQYSGGVSIWKREDSSSFFVKHLQTIKAEGWAWEVDEKGHLWYADNSKKEIYRYKPSISDKGEVNYDTAKPDIYPFPGNYTNIHRIIYDPNDDTLYISGEADGKKDKSWGLIGSVVSRYNRWIKGGRKLQWKIDTPLDDEQLQPKSWCLAGKYIFMVQVKSTKGKNALITVFDKERGKKIGNIWPGPEVGGVSGWVDTSHAIDAVLRKNGEYLILVEEDFRGKNLLYRWMPQ